MQLEGCSFPYLSPAPHPIADIEEKVINFLQTSCGHCCDEAARFFLSGFSWFYQPVASLSVPMLLRWALPASAGFEESSACWKCEATPQTKNLALLIVGGPVCCINALETPSLNLAIGNDIIELLICTSSLEWRSEGRWTPRSLLW